MYKYQLEIRERGKTKPFHTVKDIIAERCPQIGEVRHILYSAKTKAGYDQSFRTAVRIISIEGGVMQSRFWGNNEQIQEKRWHECSWWIVIAEPVAENFLPGFKRMKSNT